jgi:magnesium-protoporphyrin O-methyltransferase
MTEAATSTTYAHRRGELETYFDRTAADAWAKLTSDVKVSGIRATVRAGRDEMRATMLSWLPADLGGRRILDAGCGTGAFAIEMARRGAEVVAIDLSPTLVGIAAERCPRDLGAGSIDFRAGDMLDAGLGRFDHVVAMDSLIHYEADDIVRALSALGPRVSGSMVFTIAPRTALLAAMHKAGKLFPRADRSPAIVPHAPAALVGRMAAAPALTKLALGRSHRVARAFYISQALELVAR